MKHYIKLIHSSLQMERPGLVQLKDAVRKPTYGGATFTGLGLY